MAQNIHLFLKANGKAIEGESTEKSMGREKSIECLSVTQGMSAALNPQSGVATGRCQHQPIAIAKIVDKASPLLMKALCNNERIEAEFKFYRPSPTGDGTTEQFYTIKIEDGRIESIQQSGSAGGGEPVENIMFVYNHIIWNWMKPAITWEYEWAVHA